MIRGPQRLLTIVAGLLLAAGLAAALLPASLGGKTSYVIVSGKSMQPTMHDGDLVLVRERAIYEPGDVVAYRVPEGSPAAGSLVIHRIAKGSPAAGYTTVGDNNDFEDIWNPRPADILGERLVLIPAAGKVFAHLRAPLPIALLAGTLTTWVFLGAGRRGAPKPEDAITT